MASACLETGSYLRAIAFFPPVVYYDFSSHPLRIHERIMLLNFNSLDFYIMGLMESLYNIHIIELYCIHLFSTLNLSAHYK